jgi:PAS domain-containing protein
MQTYEHDLERQAVSEIFTLRMVPNLSGQEIPSQVWQPEHLRLAIEAARVALWSWQVDTNRITMDARAFELWGLPWAKEVAFDDLSAHIHPADQDRVSSAFNGTRSVAGPYEIDFRIILGEPCDGSPRGVGVPMKASWAGLCSESSSMSAAERARKRAMNCWPAR